jgi:hypothetical protein
MGFLFRNEGDGFIFKLTAKNIIGRSCIVKKNNLHTHTDFFNLFSTSFTSSYAASERASFERVASICILRQNFMISHEKKISTPPIYEPMHLFMLLQ